jgi:hypothetical protein
MQIRIKVYSEPINYANILVINNIKFTSVFHIQFGYMTGRRISI